MKSTLTASDVLADIEFELMQGSLSRDEIGRSLLTVRQHQARVRQEIFGNEQQDINLREALGKQFQINEMLLTLLQEMSGGYADMQRQIEWVGQARRGADQSTAAQLAGTATGSAAEPLRPTHDLDESARPEFLKQQMDLQPNGRPLSFLNGIVRRLRTGLHSLVIFYVNKLADQQTAVNQTQADWIHHLNALVRHQQEEIERLTGEVAKLTQAQK